jgi:hypothetical protein
MIKAVVTVRFLSIGKKDSFPPWRLVLFRTAENVTSNRR